MGDQIIGDLTKAFRNVAVSRKRALQILGAAIAVAVPSRLPQAAEAGKHRKPPLAFVGVTLINVDTFGGPTGFGWSFRGAVFYPTENYKAELGTTSSSIDATLPADKVRAKLVAAAKDKARIDLGTAGYDVPVDRIAAVLI